MITKLRAAELKSGTLRSMTTLTKLHLVVNPLNCPGFPTSPEGESWCDQCYTMGKMCFEIKDVYEWMRLKEEQQ